MSLREDNRNISPTYFDWCSIHDDDCPSDVNFYTYNANGLDVFLEDYSDKKNILLLTEPRGLKPENYKAVKGNIKKLDAVLTYDKKLLDKYPDKCRFYPLGGSSIHIDKWGLYPKTKDICMILSDKKTTEGHKLRHKIAEFFGDRIDLYGGGVGKPFDSKFEVLKDYRYAIVVESCKTQWYFTEKFIDAFSVGTIPIYWGCAGMWGKMDSYKLEAKQMWMMDSLKDRSRLIAEISFILSAGAKWEYERNIEAIPGIIEELKKYRIAENWIFEHHGDLFT